MEATWPRGHEPAVAGAVRIATLGPPGTSSGEAADFLADKLRAEGASGAAIDLYPSFGDAVEATLGGLADLVVIANAYGGISETYTQPDVTVVGMYFHLTPDYGLATRGGEQVSGPQIVPSHPAPIPLLAHLDTHPITVSRIERVAGPRHAAQLVADGDFDVALTHRRAVEEFGLDFVSATHPIRTSWAVFAPRFQEATS
jgi:prephenate dehydratase